MIYISIPVHENPDVIVDQMQNFSRFFPQARIVLHLSKSAVFSIEFLQKKLDESHISNVLINPTQIETKWGSIIQAHLANIRYIISQGNAEKVIFHSSNDMLVQDGVFEYVRNKKNIFHQRYIKPHTLWWVGRRSLKDNFVSDYFNHNLMASQIEGSMYEIQFLKKCLEELDKNPKFFNSKLFYPREEIFFSSFALKFAILPDGLPYVFSEVHRFDREFFRYLTKYPSLFNRSSLLGKVLKKLLEKFLLWKFDYKLSINDINSIRNRDSSMEEFSLISDGVELKWTLFKINSLFSVKRVERILNSVVREYIRGL